MKLKVGPGWDLLPLSAVRERWPDLVLFADANGAYAPLGLDGAVSALKPLEELGLASFEQPFGDDDLVAHALAGRRLRIPLCLDEALGSLGALAAALEMGACSVVNIKAGRLGGLGAAVAAHDMCGRHGVTAWCGGMVETGVGRAANLALASLPNFSLPGDISAGDRFFAEDLAVLPGLEPDGTIEVPGAPGIGTEPRRAVLERHCTWRAWYPA